jgi:hypothetical protein
MLQTIVHYGIHFLVPIIVALLCFRKNWKIAAFIMLCGIVIDLDHVLATPIFDPTRCSINFHPLHSYYAIGVYVFLFLLKKTRLIGLALLIHIIADQVDCWMM